MNLYPCCDNSDCPYCEGSGIASGPEADAFVAALEAPPPIYDTPQDVCPQCGSGSYEASPFGASYRIKCTGCGARWFEPVEKS